jgi:hypothetical protein
MKRRTFVALSVIGITGIAGIPLTHQWERLSGWGSPFAKPELLSMITNKKSISTIGHTYVQLFPKESNYNILFSLLADTKLQTDNIIHESDADVIRSRLDNKVKSDFENERTLVLDGWVLSLTEARQCALFYLLQS